jgi:hypothetical protein
MAKSKQTSARTLPKSGRARPKSARTLQPHRDHIRIVPLHQGAARVQPAGAPKLTYRNGPLLGAVEVFTVFWGDGWKSAPQNAMMPKINAFFDFILTSALIDQLAEYSTSGTKIGHGRRTGTVSIAGKLAASVTDTSIQTFVTQQITAGKLPKTTANTLYFVYMPPGVRVVMGGSSSCTAFCGYHSAIGTKVFYAVMPYPTCTGCLGGSAAFDALTSTSSHELCEAITDPIPGAGWYDDANGEIGDICAWQTKQIGEYSVQLEWSNNANACV